MTNKEKYRKAFMEELDVSEEQLEDLEYQGIPSWDSVGHMGLINQIEEAFDITLDTEDIIEFSSYEKGISILKKYDIDI